MKKIKIVYLTGYWYSGATIIGRSFVCSNQAIYVGEIRDFWVKGLKQNRKCSCGENFKDCRFWESITNNYFDSFPSSKIEEITKEMTKFERGKNYFKLRKFIKHKSDESFRHKLGNYLKHTEKLYEIISEISGKNIIVDSSRIPVRLLALSLSKEIEIFPIFVMRDPRGVINSLIKKDMRNYGENRHNTFSHIINWNAKNLLSLDAMRILKHNNGMHLLYKTFTKAPTIIFKNLESKLNCKFIFEEENDKVSLNLEQGHVFTGNRSRYNFGKITINEDIQWKQQLNGLNKILISIGSLPIYKFIASKYRLNNINIY